VRDFKVWPLGHFEVDQAAGIRCCGALWTGCCFGRDGARNNPHSEALQFPGSLHLPLHLDRNRNHFLARRDRSRSARLLTFFFGGEHFGEEPFPFADFQFGTFPYLLRDRQLVDGLVSASRRRAEQFLIEARNNLELRVAERTGELTRANEDLQNTQAELRRREAYLAGAQRLSHTGSFGWSVSPARSCGRRKPIASFNTTER